MPRPQRRATSLTLPGPLLDEARGLGINVSRAAEDGLEHAVRQARTAAWQRDNAEAIEAYNAMIDAHGVPLGAFRKF